MHNFRELKVWQKSRVLVKEVYLLTSQLPQTEKYNLASQMQSAAVSVISNIAEGSGRGSDVDFARFLDMSLGSSHELESQIIVASDLSFINLDDYKSLTDVLSEIQRMLIGLMNKLRRQKN